MAAPVVTMAGGGHAKVRDPGIVALFFALTLGFIVYPQVWYYKINRELRDYGRAQGDEELAQSNPTMSVLAVTLGALIIVPPFVSWYRATKRIQRAQELAGTGGMSGWLMVAFYIGALVTTVAGLGIPVVVQDNLNKIWKTLPEATDASATTVPVPEKSSADKALET
ncbi:MAG: hypothetical protein QOD60_705 [Solirubrobacterales bacterium]|nr:hypothetical protein [Solirubrobacterales bacterium]